MENTREKNNNWKGGRTISAHGYILIRVGVEHPSADIRGYVYEHKLIMEKKIGRRLKKGEMVHHEDRNKQNNKPENLILISSNREHYLFHRKRKDLRMPREENPPIVCQCGCGIKFNKYDFQGRPRRFIPGHNLQRRNNG